MMGCSFRTTFTRFVSAVISMWFHSPAGFIPLVDAARASSTGPPPAGRLAVEQQDPAGGFFPRVELVVDRSCCGAEHWRERQKGPDRCNDPTLRPRHAHRVLRIKIQPERFTRPGNIPADHVGRCEPVTSICA